MFETSGEGDLAHLVDLMLRRPEALGPEGLATIREGIRGPVTLERVAQRLVEGLSDPEWRVRERAAMSFHELVDALSVPRSLALAGRVLSSFLERLGEEEELGVYKALLGTLTAFAQAFSRMGNLEIASRVLEAFQAQLTSLRDRSSLSEVIAALGSIQDPRSLGILVGLIQQNELFEVCADALVAQGGRAVPALVQSLEKSEERTQRMRVVDVLVRIGEEAERETLALLGDAQWFVRRNAAFVLAYVGGERSALALVKTAFDREPRVRAEAVRALGRLGGIEAEQAFLHALKDEDLSVALAAAEALGKHGGAEALAALSGIIDKHGVFGVSSSVEMRQAAARALGRIGDPGALPALLKGTFDSNPGVKAACQEAVQAIKDKGKEH
jgi:HEAT repeat protein